jgi:hypothetical protein
VEQKRTGNNWTGSMDMQHDATTKPLYTFGGRHGCIVDYETNKSHHHRCTVVCQTNGTYDGRVLFIAIVIDGKDQIAFLSSQVALVIFS